MARRRDHTSIKTRLVITDITRMQQRRVCVAGIDEHNCCIRPVLPPPGIPEHSLLKDGKPIIFQFAQVEFDLLVPDPEPPHTEDYHYRADSPVFIQKITDRFRVLNNSLFKTVEEIFGQPVLTDQGYYVQACQGTHSLGTIRPRKIIRVKYTAGEDDTWNYRLQFLDPVDEFYSLKITDLTWQYYCRSLRGEDRDSLQIADELTAKLKSLEVYLRIGLARGWEKFPDRCYLQITGIYTFPDYLQGKNFSDFIPR